MTDYIHIPHFQQSSDGYCLSACIRMVLAHLGTPKTEKEISRLIDANAHGTPVSRVERLTKWGFAVDYSEREILALPQILIDGTPIIVPVRTKDLGYWKDDVPHAVVIVGIEPEIHFWIYDPHLANGPVKVPWDGMLAAWFEFAYRGATLQRKKQFSLFDWVRKVVNRD